MNSSSITFAGRVVKWKWTPMSRPATRDNGYSTHGKGGRSAFCLHGQLAKPPWRVLHKDLAFREELNLGGKLNFMQ